MTTRPDLIAKWQPILEHPSMPAITDYYRKGVTAVLLENQERDMRDSMQAGNLFETSPVNGVGIGQIGTVNATATGGVTGYDPVLISLVRRAMPQNIGFDVCGVQPMTQPTGLIFAMKSRYGSQTGAEALFDEANTNISGLNHVTLGSTVAGTLFDGDGTNAASVIGTAQTTIAQTLTTGGSTGNGMATVDGEGNANWSQMAFSIEKTSVVARTRALKAEYSDELAQDLKAVHGLDAAAELSSILSQEITAEINREIVRTIYMSAVPGAVTGTVATAGTFDLDVDSNGRWSVEKFKGLMFQIEREANAIGQQTRRGRGNFIITSADVASALAMAGVLDYSSGLSNNLNVDDTSTTYAGVLNGKYKVYVDPYAMNSSATQYFVVGYKGSSAFDAGIFYCPYVPLQMVRSQDPNTFQPKIGFRTRYGIVSNPFAANTGVATEGLYSNKNVYYRKVMVNNLM